MPCNHPPRCPPNVAFATPCPSRLRGRFEIRHIAPEIAHRRERIDVSRRRLCRRRSCLESGTRVNKSSSTRARASIRAISRLANALCTMSSSKLASDDFLGRRDFSREVPASSMKMCARVSVSSRDDAKRNVHLLIGCSPMRDERHPAQDLVRVLSARKYRKPRTSHGQRTGGKQAFIDERDER